MCVQAKGRQGPTVAHQQPPSTRTRCETLPHRDCATTKVTLVFHIDSSTAVWHTGQVRLMYNQGSMHRTWKLWKHGSTRRASPTSNESRHTTHMLAAGSVDTLGVNSTMGSDETVVTCAPRAVVS